MSTTLLLGEVVALGAVGLAWFLGTVQGKAWQRKADEAEVLRAKMEAEAELKWARDEVARAEVECQALREALRAAYEADEHG